MEEIRKEIPGVMPPQKYFVLENHPKLKNLLEKQPLDEKLFVHSHDEIYYDNLAMSVSELEKTTRFKELDSDHQKENDFDSIFKWSVVQYK